MEISLENLYLDIGAVWTNNVCGVLFSFRLSNWYET